MAVLGFIKPSTGSRSGDGKHKSGPLQPLSTKTSLSPRPPSQPLNPILEARSSWIKSGVPFYQVSRYRGNDIVESTLFNSLLLAGNPSRTRFMAINVKTIPHQDHFVWLQSAAFFAPLTLFPVSRNDPLILCKAALTNESVMGQNVGNINRRAQMQQSFPDRVPIRRTAPQISTLCIAAALPKISLPARIFPILRAQRAPGTRTVRVGALPQAERGLWQAGAVIAQYVATNLSNQTELLAIL
ncbi:hypothetical protein B0H19DRAFT_1085148 [Mycena capillaripes]|nr:hypothetical protein B0H19DRAFT_1085148 [Mycena capillaripes]